MKLSKEDFISLYDYWNVFKMDGRCTVISLEPLDNIKDTIEALQQENEQLKAQLDLANERVETERSRFLASHNPVDVEALKVVREALELIYKKHVDIPNHNKYPKSTSICRDAIAAIDKIDRLEVAE